MLRQHLFPVLNNMTKKALVLIAHGTEEMEAIIPVDVLRRAGIHTTLASVESEKTVKCSRDVRIQSDALLTEVASQPFDAIVIPGGLGGAKTMSSHQQVLSLIRSYYDSGRLVASICAGPTVLAAAGIAHNAQITSYPSVRSKLDKDYQYREDDVVQDKNLITSRGPGTAMAFALAIARYLVGDQTTNTVAEQILFK
jgi:protein DJ-1